MTYMAVTTYLEKAKELTFYVLSLISHNTLSDEYVEKEALKGNSSTL